MIPLPSPNSDPTGLAALVGVLATSVVVALGVDGVWGPVIGAAVPLVAIVLARCKSWAPATVQAKVEQVVDETRVRTLEGKAGVEARADIGPFQRRPPPVVGPDHEGPVP